MLIMLLDHVRERFFYHHVITDPMTIDQTDPDLFFTRLIAHLCAPVFVLLTGISAWLYANPANGQPRDVRAFLLKRGVVLVLIEATLINFSWFGAYETLYLQVIWAIGLSMIALALLSSLPLKVIAALGLAIVAGHNALEPIQFAPEQWGYTIWTILHDRGFILDQEWLRIKASYPVLPWIGVILVGFAMGPLFSRMVEASKRQRTLLQLSAASLALLALLRGSNLYGETAPWQVHSTTIETVMSFLNFTKYPPSLDFILLTVGIACTLLCLLERYHHRATDYLSTFGSAPMFFYIVHLYVLLIGYRIMTAIFGANQGDMYGFDSLWMIWATTALLALVMYWPTKAFARYKHSSNKAWVKYL
ncbi:DUF1624 domain-containing protein [Ferrimonas lipolytica]|uniref:DUF1624 domain-containing protein n=2 Tax=Ferrimonas lipolytica TaxID=2724191 RepID=A0A6H1UIJ0_9GAMM|nr:DUF1624 domain-containing protein [Ferrimonas lipolytica]